jgi:hypothetical protein
MKAVTINISLNPELAEFARSEEQIKQDVALLEKAIAGAPAGDPSDEDMAGIVKTQHRQRAERKRLARRA